MAASVQDTIRKRISQRTYDGRILTAGDRDTLEAYIKEENKNPFWVKIRLAIVDSAATGERLGTYGMITGARAYLAGAAEIGRNSLAAYGYAVEGVILKAAEMGIGTCWLGGTFTRGAFARAIGLTDNEWMPAVTPLGYPRAKGGLRVIIRAMTGAEKRKPWETIFFDGSADVPLAPEQAGAYAECLEAVRLAPSAVNRQPWRIIKTADRFDFYSAGKPGGDPLWRHDLIDLGIAMRHFDLTAEERGLSGHWAFDGKDRSGLVYIASWVCV